MTGVVERAGALVGPQRGLGVLRAARAGLQRDPGVVVRRGERGVEGGGLAVLSDGLLCHMDRRELT